jgi:large subunit ribosomal protein L17
VRHNVYGKKLGRDKNERTALFKSLVQALVVSEKIQTTQAKAKAIKGLVDRIINDAKIKPTQHLVNQFFNNKKISEKLISDLAPRLKGRTSGYTSVVKLGRRMGDDAMVVQMSLLLESSAVSRQPSDKSQKVGKEMTSDVRLQTSGKIKKSSEDRSPKTEDTKTPRKAVKK